MSQTLYSRFIKPSSKEPDRAAREVVLNYLLAGTLVLTVVSLLDTAAVFLISGHHFLLGRMLSNGLAILFVLALYALARSSRYHAVVAFILMSAIAGAGALVAYQWGVLNSNGLLLFSLAVIMAGILVKARYSLYLASCIAVLLVVLEYTETHGYLHPNLSWLSSQPTLSDMIGFSVLLFVIASVSWLFNQQMELALRRVRRSEKALERQKTLLEVKVKQRTEQLEATQLEQLQELYRFAELGRLSTALFHDLANHLTTVSVDIEGLKQRHKSDIMQRLQDNIHHIDVVVQRVRQQIQGKSMIEVFSVYNEIEEVIKLSAFSAAKSDVTLSLETGNVRPSLLYKGDALRFRQILINTISNGIEAYTDVRRKPTDKQVVIRLQRRKTTLHISVIDQGVGITPGNLSMVFEPFYSTKVKGIGIGLFIVKQVVEHDFGGSLELVSNPESGTVLSVSLPKSHYAKPGRT